MANEFDIDTNTWYQISNEQYDPNSRSLRVGNDHVSIFMYTTNTDAYRQRWQIAPVLDGGWNFRAQIEGPGVYMSQCTQLTGSKHHPVRTRGLALTEA
jgi:hypothetical protein